MKDECQKKTNTGYSSLIELSIRKKSEEETKE